MALNLRMIKISLVEPTFAADGDIPGYKVSKDKFWYVAADNIAYIDEGSECARVFIKHDLSGEGGGNFLVTKEDLEKILKCFIVN